MHQLYKLYAAKPLRSSVLEGSRQEVLSWEPLRLVATVLPLRQSQSLFWWLQRRDLDGWGIWMALPLSPLCRGAFGSFPLPLLSLSTVDVRTHLWRWAPAARLATQHSAMWPCWLWRRSVGRSQRDSSCQSNPPTPHPTPRRPPCSASAGCFKHVYICKIFCHCN